MNLLGVIFKGGRADIHLKVNTQIFSVSLLLRIIYFFSNLSNTHVVRLVNIRKDIMILIILHFYFSK